MSRMFCTLKEAAQTLHASEDQIEALLDSGILPEFREGPHRLLREADVGALALKRRRRSKTQRAARPQTRAKRPSSSPDGKTKASGPAERRLPRSSTVAPRRPRSRQRENRGQRAEDRRPSSVPHPPSSEVPPPALVPPNPSVRQWFWMGLVQDRPVAIALLSGLVLLILSALVAGLCFAAETW